MKNVESECVDCGLPCLGSGCRYYRVTRYYCDDCGDEDIPSLVVRADGAILCARHRLSKVA